jgi:hypothetical protein
MDLRYRRMIISMNDFMSTSRGFYSRPPSGTQQPSQCQEMLDRQIHFSVLSPRNRPTSDEYQIVTGHHESQPCSRRLAQQSLDPVAIYGLADPLAHREPKTAVVQSVWKRTKDQKEM